MDANTSFFNRFIKDHKYCNLGVEKTNIWRSTGGGNNECGLSISSRFRKHLKPKLKGKHLKNPQQRLLLLNKYSGPFWMQ